MRIPLILIEGGTGKWSQRLLLLCWRQIYVPPFRYGDRLWSFALLLDRIRFFGTIIIGHQSRGKLSEVPEKPTGTSDEARTLRMSGWGTEGEEVDIGIRKVAQRRPDEAVMHEDPRIVLVKEVCVCRDLS